VKRRHEGRGGGGGRAWEVYGDSLLELAFQPFSTLVTLGPGRRGAMKPGLRKSFPCFLPLQQGWLWESGSRAAAVHECFSVSQVVTLFHDEEDSVRERAAVARPAGSGNGEWNECGGLLGLLLW